MSAFEEELPPVTPENQDQRAAHAGGTDAMQDFSPSAQRSKNRLDFRHKNPPFENPSRDERAPEMGEGEDLGRSAG